MPAVVLEAQMAANPDFPLRLYAESARLLQQEHWQKDWQVVVSGIPRALGGAAAQGSGTSHRTAHPGARPDLLARFNTRPLQEICQMGGITLEDFTQSVAYQEICCWRDIPPSRP